MPGEAAQQQPPGDLALLSERLANGRQPGDRGRERVVEADHRQVSGDGEAGLPRRLADADPELVAHAEDRRRARAAGQQAQTGVAAGGDRVVSSLFDYNTAPVDAG